MGVKGIDKDISISRIGGMRSKNNQTKKFIKIIKNKLSKHLNWWFNTNFCAVSLYASHQPYMVIVIKCFLSVFTLKKLCIFFYNTLILLQVLKGCERSGRVIFSGALESYILKFFLQSYSYQIRGVAIWNTPLPFKWCTARGTLKWCSS